MRTSVVFGAKNSDFSKYMVCLHGQEGGEVEPVRTFYGQGGGVNFSRFCADVYYGRPQRFLEVQNFRKALKSDLSLLV